MKKIKSKNSIKEIILFMEKNGIVIEFERIPFYEITKISKKKYAKKWDIKLLLYTDETIFYKNFYSNNLKKCFNKSYKFLTKNNGFNLVGYFNWKEGS